MGDQSKGMFAQILVGVVTGIVIGILSGSLTAAVRVNTVEKNLEVYMSQAKSAELQTRRDIVRLEQSDLNMQREIQGIADNTTEIRTTTLVILERLKQWEPQP